MPAKKKKFNARFPPARIKKIMQSDEEVGKVAQVVPVIMSKALETFVASLLHKSSSITRARNARTLTPAHIKSSILSDPEFEFLRELAQSIPDVNTNNEGDELTDVGGTGSSGQGNNNNHHQSSQNRLQRRSSQNKNSTQTHHKRGRPKKIVKQESVEKEPSDEEDDDDDDEDEDEEQDIDEDDKDQEQEDKEEFQCSNPSSQFVSFQTKTESKSMIVIEEDNDYDN